MIKNEFAIFGTGCFWCTEAIFKELRGVISVMPGYAGGTAVNPTYEQVCTGLTGHAEVARIEFDPKAISYSDLLEIFWNVHDPTSLNRQGNDVGTQYRSIILAISPAQKEAAERSLQAATRSGQFGKPIVTDIQPLNEFYPAEDYHRDYYALHQNQPYCRLVISPKLMHLRQEFKAKLKS